MYILWWHPELLGDSHCAKHSEQNTEEHAVQVRFVSCKMIKKTKRRKHQTYSTTGFATNFLV